MKEKKTKTYSVAMGAVVVGETASPRTSTILRGLIGRRCYTQFAGGQMEEVLDGGFVLSYLPDMASVEAAVSALRQSGVDTALFVSEEIDNGETIESSHIKTIPASTSRAGRYISAERGGIMKLTDGKKVVEVRMQVWNGSGYDPDWSQDFFEAGGLPTDDATGASVVDDVDYCIDQAQDWANKQGDYAGVAPWEVDEERFVFVTEY